MFDPIFVTVLVASQSRTSGCREESCPNHYAFVYKTQNKSFTLGITFYMLYVFI